MANPIVRQDGFAGGEVAPEFYARTSDPRYHSSLRACKNFLPLRHGMLLNRPGTRFIAHTKADAQAQLQPFIFSDGQTFALEFGNLYVRFYTNGGQVQTAPGVPYEVATPYAIADVPRLKFAQSGDVIVITHPSYQPRELARLANTNWVLTLASFSPQAYFGGAPFIDKYDAAVSSAIAWDAILAATLGYAKGFIVQYQPGGVGAFRLYRSQVDANNSQPDIGTWDDLAYNAGTTYSKGQYVWGPDAQVYLSLIERNFGNTPSGTPAAWAVATDAQHPAKKWQWLVTILWRDSKGVVRETAGTVVFQGAYGTLTAVATDRPAKVSWTAPGAQAFFFQVVGYNVYRGIGGLFGLVASAAAGDTSVVDPGTTPNFAIQPPRGTNPFVVADGANQANTTKWPGAVAYHDSRRVYARSDVKPNRFLGSKLDDFPNFDVNFPVQDTDAYDFGVASEQLEEIRSLLSLNRLLMFTGHAVFAAEGQQGQSIKPTSIQVRREQGEHGASYLQPLAVGTTALYVTAKGNYVRDVAFDWRVNGLDGVDLTEYARHLFDANTITRWCYAGVPFRTVWAVRDDGVLLSMTYDRAAQVWGWARHATRGAVESICSVPEGTEDAVYLVVRRNNQRFVERMASRALPRVADGVDEETGLPKYRADVRFAVFLDASLQFDGRNSGATTMRVSGATYEADDLVTVLASAASFANTDVGDQLVVDPDGTPTRITVTAFVDATHVTGRLEAPLLLPFQDFATNSWGWARNTITGLGHLEGQIVKVLADGNVQGPLVVAGGVVLLNPPALIAQVGLSYNSDLELLDVASDAVKPNVKSVIQVIFEVVASRGIFAGEDFDHLRPAKLRKLTDNFGAPALVTDQVPVKVESGWNSAGGRAVLRQSDPLPLTIGAVMREVAVGGRP